MALYLKYRPQTFDELVKQEQITNILKPKVLNSDYAHSNFLFYGPRWTGKTSTARIFAKAINCTDLQGGNPCNRCDNCNAINSGKTIDVIEIDAASHTQVENIRVEIINKAPYPPAHLKKKVYIIDEVHMLSRYAFNALLKIMEEPPSYLVFVLATTEIHKVPETIISRCQIFTFKKIPVADLTAHLKKICDIENFPYTNEALISIARISDGCARDAIKYLDQVSIFWDITQDNVSSFLGVAGDQLITSFLTAYKAQDTNTCFALIDTFHTSWIDIANFIRQSLQHIEEHFQEDIAWNIACIDFFKRINSGLRNFPLPIILMKMEVYNGLNSSNASPIEKKTPSTILEQSPTPRGALERSPQPANTTSQDVHSSNDSKQWDDTQNRDTNITLDVWQNTSTKDTYISNKDPNHSDDNSLLLQIAETPWLATLAKACLLKSAILEEQEDGAILYLFNKLQASSVQKPETLSLIEKSYKEITGRNHGIKIIVTTKESYFAEKL